MLQVLQVLQAIGAAAGLVSALYLAWQFGTKRLPVAIFVPRKAFDLSTEATQFLRVKNPSDRPMIVRFENNTGQNELRIMLDSSTRSAVYAAVGASIETIIDAGETKEFRLGRRADHNNIDTDSVMFACFVWRYAQPFVLRVERKCRVTVTRRDYDALIANPYTLDEN